MSLGRPHWTLDGTVKLVLDVRRYHMPSAGRHTARSVVPSPS
jgi:hypothetical protein